MTPTATAPNGIPSSSKATSGPLDIKSMLSKAALARPPSAIRSLFPAEQIPGMISLLAGKPNAETFPISEISLTVKPSPALEGASADDKPKELDDQVRLTVKGQDLENGLQYSATAGLPALNKWLVDFQCLVHRKTLVTDDEASRGKTPWRVSVGMGSQDLLTKSFEAILNPGDTILVEDPAYAGILPTLQMCHANIVPVPSDAEGVSDKALDSILANWSTSSSTPAYPFPKALYTTPTGANPAGTTASIARKRSILALARKHRFLIMEDDPYMFLSFEGLGEDPVTRTRTRSYFALEEEEHEQHGTGFVVRYDSMSKVVSAGLRVGWMTGPTALCDAVDLDTSSANLQPSGASQLICHALLAHWGPSGFLKHVDGVASFYKRRRDRFEAAASRILGTDGGKQKAVAKWVTPVAGMFLWMTLNLGPGGDSYELISNKAKAKGILAVPGLAFTPDGSRSACVRTSFSLIPEDQIDEGLRRLRAVVIESWADKGGEAAMPADF